jgi:YD repeat-containing protein
MRRNRADITVKPRGNIAPSRWRGVRRILALAAGAAVATVGLSATTGYQYDALGRLIQVTHNNGNVTTYAYDAAGNRTLVDEVMPVTPPASITVPATNSTGSYSVSWTAGGTVARYELYESTNSGFATQTRVYQGTGTSASLSGHGNGTYYYRVRGCTGNACTAYRTGSNGVVVNLAPPAPTGLSKNQNSQCSWYASWNASAGATYYTIRDWSGNFQYSVNAPATNTTYSFCNVPGYTGDPNDYRPKWLKACNASACSNQTNFP